MKAIQTRIPPATDTKPKRYKAWAFKCKPMIISDEALGHEDDEDKHKEIAGRYAASLGLSFHFESGCLPNGDYAHCFRADRITNERYLEFLATMS